MSDPLHDLERRVDRIEAKVDLSDQGLRNDIDGIRADIRRLTEERGAFVPLMRYVPVERVVYGLVSVTLLSVATALVALVVRS